MGKAVLAIGLIILMVCTVGANQTLVPVDIGTPNTTGQDGGGDPYLYSEFWVGHSEFNPDGSACGACHAVVEFDLSGVNMTEAQFCQAFLNGLKIREVSPDEGTDPPGDGIFTVQVYDLDDLNEDGAVTSGDFGKTTGAIIATLNIAPGSEDTVFNNIDVTQAVRHDLFDPGHSNYSGFILVSTDM